MADLNGTIVRGNLRVTDDTNINGSLTVTGASAAFPSSVKFSGINSNGALIYNSAGTLTVSTLGTAASYASTAFQPAANYAKVVYVGTTSYAAAANGNVSLPAYPTVSPVYNSTLTIQKNGTAVGTFTANQSTNSTINITVPTNAASVNALADTTNYTSKIKIGTATTEYAPTNGVITLPAYPTVPTIPGAQSGITLANSKYGHANASITAGTTQSVYSIKYDSYGHITAATAVTIPAAQVNADWNATTGKSSILNKPAVIVGNASNNYSWFDVKSISGKYTYAIGASVYAVSTVVSFPYLKVYQSESNVGYYETHYGTDTIAFTGSVTGGTSFAWTYAFPEKSGTFAMTTDIPTNFPPKDHASTATTYGSATDTKYGHVKLVSGNVSGTTYAAGVAAAASHHHDGVYLKAQVQADWNVTTTTEPSYIKNKPTIPTNTNQTVKAGTVTFGANDAVNFVGGGNVTVTGNATNKDITISYTTPGSLKNPNALDIYGNTTSVLSYDGSAKKSLYFKSSTSLGYFTVGDGTTTQAVYVGYSNTDTHYTSAFSVYAGNTNVVTFTQAGSKSVQFSAGTGISISGSASGSAYGIVTISAPLYAHNINWKYDNGYIQFDLIFTVYNSISTAMTLSSMIYGYLPNVAIVSGAVSTAMATGTCTIPAGSMYGYQSTFCNIAGVALTNNRTSVLLKLFSIYTLSGSTATFNFKSSPYLLTNWPELGGTFTDISATMI